MCQVGHLFTCHLTPVSCLLSPATCHLPPVTCHLPPVTCHLARYLTLVTCMGESIVRIAGEHGKTPQVPLASQPTRGHVT